MKQKQKALRRSLWASALAIVLCAAMLLGTTFAWFTDTVSSTDNTIKSGTLTINLNGNETGTTLFAADENSRWEPGFSRWVKASVANTGTLWLKYGIQVVIEEDKGGLANVLDVYTSKTETDPSSIEGMTRIGTVAELASDPTKLTGGSFGILAPKGQGETVDSVTYTDSAPLCLVIKMQEGAGNQYQDKTIKFNIDVKATQYTKEKDGFENDQYDKDAPLEFTSVSTSAELGKVLRAGGNAILEKDVTFSRTVIRKDTTIDLNGHTLKGTTVSNKDALLVNGANVTVSNGTIEAPAGRSVSSSALLVEGDSTVTIENCTLKTNSNQSLTVCTNGSNSKNSTIVIRNSKIIAPTVAGKKGYAAYIPAGNVTLENCDVTGHILICGGNVTLDGGTYTATGFNNQAKIWNKADTATYVGGRAGGIAFTMGDSILIADRRAGYTLSGLTIRNITFNTEITLKDKSKAVAYGIKYVDMNKNGAAAPVTYTIENNKFNNKLADGTDPVMYIDLNGNDIA